MKNQDRPEPGERKSQTDSTNTSPRAKNATASPTSRKATVSDVPQQTQSHFKALQRFRDLSQNERFQKELSEIAGDQDADSIDRKLGGLLARYDFDVFPHLQSLFVDGALAASPDSFDTDVDYCRTVDESRELESYLELVEKGEEQTLEDSREEWRFLGSVMFFPIHICISPLATKRDVLRYVEKRWPEIRSQQQKYHKKPVRIVKRRKEARDKYIWENRGRPSEDLAADVRKLYGDEAESYDIKRIILKLQERMK